MDTVIKVIGLLFMIMGAWLAARPEGIKQLMGFFKEGKRLYIAGGIRLVLAIVFLLSARECDVVWFIIAVGILFLIGGVLIFTMKLEKLKGWIDWWLGKSDVIIRSLLVFVLLFGALIIWAA